jgi:hypothetical protein
MYTIKAKRGNITTKIDIDGLLSRSIKAVASKNDEIIKSKKLVSDLSDDYLIELNSFLDGTQLKSRFKASKAYVEHQNWHKIEIGDGLSRISIIFSMDYISEEEVFDNEIKGKLKINKNWDERLLHKTYEFGSVSDILELCEDNLGALMLYEKYTIGEIDFKVYKDAVKNFKY